MVLEKALRQALEAEERLKGSSLEEFLKENKDEALVRAVRPAGLLRAILAACAARSDTTGLLLSALRSRSVEARESAARALSLRRAPGAPAAIFKAMAGVERYALGGFLAALDPLASEKDLPALLAMLGGEDEPAKIGAAWLLARHGAWAREEAARLALGAALKDEKYLVRMYAAEALGRAGEKASAPALRALLADTDSDVRATAAEALGKIEDLDGCREALVVLAGETYLDPRYLPAMAVAGGDFETKLLLKFSASNAWLDQYAGIAALGLCGRPEARARLIEIVQNPDSAFQTLAGEALARQGEAGVRALQPLGQAPSPAVRARAIYLLSGFRVQGAFERMVEALEDPGEGVRAVALWGLNRLAEGQGPPPGPLSEEAERKAYSQRWKAAAKPAWFVGVREE
jgi:HEAT repeat protein